MAYEIHKTKVRDSLPPRVREPYWGFPLARGRALGYRKIASDRSYWIARMRPEGQGSKYEYEPLGAETRDFDYEKARQAAMDWFETRDAGVDSAAITVAAACRQYVDDRRSEKGDNCANDAEKRFERTVFGNKSFAAIPLSKLRAPRLKEWRDGLELSKPSSDRTLANFKAAMHLAIANGRVHAGLAVELKRVKPYGARAGKRRDLFLDLKQRRKLLECAEGAVRDLIEAAALIGARAGELTSARRSQFDGRLQTIALNGKTGARTIPLSPAALKLFRRLAKGKLPAASLLTRDDGKPWAHSDWDEMVRGAAEKAKLPKGVCLYTLRHSFITQAITDGMTTLDVARLCGTSVGMIEKHYGHLVEDAARKRLASVTML
jgi:integrase